MKKIKDWLPTRWVAVLAAVWLGGSASLAPAAEKTPAEKTPAGKKSEPVVAGTEYLNVGDRVRISYSDIPVTVPPTEQQIPETRKLVLHLNLVVEFVGKTKSELEREIRDLYISKGLYKNIKIDIEVPGRPVWVGGEVKSESTYAHQANLTLTKAINMAGGFTEFAKKRRVIITRADGTRIFVNWNRASKNPADDPPILPGDRIQVDRSVF